MVQEQNGIVAPLAPFRRRGRQCPRKVATPVFSDPIRMRRFSLTQVRPARPAVWLSGLLPQPSRRARAGRHAVRKIRQRVLRRHLLTDSGRQRLVFERSENSGRANATKVVVRRSLRANFPVPAGSQDCAARFWCGRDGSCSATAAPPVAMSRNLLLARS